MLLMCLPFVIYTASMQMFLESFGSPVQVRTIDARTEEDR